MEKEESDKKDRKRFAKKKKLTKSKFSLMCMS